MYPVHEVFNSFQGEGQFSGTPAFFIRLFGCPIQCPWCDAAGTWHPEYIPKTIERQSAFELANLARESMSQTCIITGGEPCIHDLTDLAYALRTNSLKTHLETSGAYPIKGELDWITVSPKWAAKPMSQNLERANEWKIIVEDEHSIDEWWRILEPVHSSQIIWLHPEWSARQNPRVWASIYKWSRQIQGRIGLQAHKYWGDVLVDTLDSRSQAAVPLGGDVNRGF
jgi:organic radical activating enzyme